MSDEIQPSLSDTTGSLFPLLIQANAIAKTLAEHRYHDEPVWIAEVMTELRHGLLKTEALMYPDAPLKSVIWWQQRFDQLLRGDGSP